MRGGVEALPTNGVNVGGTRIRPMRGVDGLERLFSIASVVAILAVRVCVRLLACLVSGEFVVVSLFYAISFRLACQRDLLRL